jgi:4-amino-4-deoxy-L-arabinose transferase-like glycosyltransferase
MKLAPFLTHQRSISAWKTVPFALFLAALLPRLLALGRYITPDELVWVYRSIRFREALLTGQWLDTLTAGHPGVITTWLGTVGISLQLILHPNDRTLYEWLSHVAWLAPDNMMAYSQLAKLLTSTRLVTAAINSLGIVLIYWLAKASFGRQTALVGALLLALDPFVAGLSGLLHVDGLMTTFATISLLALALGIRAQVTYSYLVLSGAAAALAALTKSPALLLLPLSGALILFGAYRHKESVANGPMRGIMTQGAAWLSAFFLTAMLLFPALWASLGQVAQLTSQDAARHMAGAFRTTFFMGQANYDHGYTFYPIALAFRVGPVVTLGLLLAGFQLLGSVRRQAANVSVATMTLVLWAVIYCVGISLAAKKFDRYALPVIPALTLIAVLSWFRLVSKRGKHTRQVASILLAAQFLYLLSVVPYPLAAYNPILGGAKTAEKVLTIGWGEAISAAGHWLASRPNAASQRVIGGSAPSLAPYFPGETLLFTPDNLFQADYVVLSNNDRQLDPIAFQEIAAGAVLIHTIRYAGLDQAWIYAQPDAAEPVSPLTVFATPLRFDNRMELLGAGTAPSHGGDDLYFYAKWRVLQLPGSFAVQLTLRDLNSQVWSEQESVLLNTGYFYPADWGPDEAPEVRYALQLPAAMPPGIYELELSLFDQDGSRQLPVLAADGEFRGVVYRSKVTLLPTERLAALDELEIPVTHGVTWQDGLLQLLGSSELPTRLPVGTRMPIDLFWQAHGPLSAELRLAFSLDGALLDSSPLSRFDSGRWRSGEVIHEKYSLLFAPELEPGWHELRVRVIEHDGQPVPGPTESLGSIELEATDRLFTLPADIPVDLDYSFAETVSLRGLNAISVTVAPGDLLTFSLFWQSTTEPKERFNAFVHLLGPDGQLVAQADQWPGSQPSNSWITGQVIVDHYAIELPVTAPAGAYQMVVGLYRLSDGRRLTIVDPDEAVLPDQRVLLPVDLMVTEASE